MLSSILYRTGIIHAVCMFFILLPGNSSIAGAQALPVDRNVTKSYAKGFRARSGAPGKNYWQNTGNYKLAVQFDPASRNLKGNALIDYINNSPDTLTALVFKLFPNLYKADAMRNTAISAADISPGLLIHNMSINGHTIDSLKRNVRGTNMYVKGLYILPGQHTQIDIDYNYVLNKGSFIRTGQIDTGACFLAYFFPRVAVYDDIDGWDEHQYLGKEEFYNDYGNFDVSISLPGNYRAWATGDLKNTTDVYGPEFAERIHKAEMGDSVVDIITLEDIANRHITKDKNMLSWHFMADGVTDFAFAVSSNYVWKAASIMVDTATHRRTRVDAVYNPMHQTYLPVVDFNRKTVELISYLFPAIPFPYTHETIVDGLDAMEYPMMVNNLPFQDPKDVVEFTAHEVFHSLFPFYVGTNETKYSFMDEGGATMTEFMFHPLIAPGIKFDYDLSSVNDYAGVAEDMPLITPTPQLYGKARFADKDLKPALALWYLKDMLGEKLFVSAMKSYISQWAGKHPTPYDFFNCITTASKQNLNWFWRAWYFEKAIPDLAISNVQRTKSGYRVTIENVGGAPVPIHLSFFHPDGSKQVLTRNCGAWAAGQKNVTVTVETKEVLNKIILGGPYDADINMKNNTWAPQVK